MERPRIKQFFKGEELLNGIYGRKNVVRIIASLPGPYTLMLLTKAIFHRDHQRLNLTKYPQYDLHDKSEAEPYDPAMNRRYPTTASAQHIAYAPSELLKVAEPINPNIASVFFNVRSSLDTKTAVELMWQNIQGDKAPAGSSPLTGVPGPGDGTVPAWSAWHAYARTNNRYELRQASSHGALLEHDEVLAVIASIVANMKFPAIRKRAARAPTLASKRKVDQVMQQWAKNAKAKPKAPKELFEAPVQRAILANLMAGPRPKQQRSGHEYAS